jgi:hypothetical protein
MILYLRGINATLFCNVFLLLGGAASHKPDTAVRGFMLTAGNRSLAQPEWSTYHSIY